MPTRTRERRRLKAPRKMARQASRAFSEGFVLTISSGPGASSRPDTRCRQEGGRRVAVQVRPTGASAVDCAKAHGKWKCGLPSAATRTKAGCAEDKRGRPTRQSLWARPLARCCLGRAGTVKRQAYEAPAGLAGLGVGSRDSPRQAGAHAAHFPSRCGCRRGPATTVTLAELRSWPYVASYMASHGAAPGPDDARIARCRTGAVSGKTSAMAASSPKQPDIIMSPNGTAK